MQQLPAANAGATFHCTDNSCIAPACLCVCILGSFASESRCLRNGDGSFVRKSALMSTRTVEAGEQRGAVEDGGDG